MCVCVRYVSVFMHTTDLKSVIDKKFSSFFPKKPHRIPVFFYFIFFYPRNPENALHSAHLREREKVTCSVVINQTQLVYYANNQNEK